MHSEFSVLTVWMVSAEIQNLVCFGAGAGAGGGLGCSMLLHCPPPPPTGPFWAKIIKLVEAEEREFAVMYVCNNIKYGCGVQF
jgi:hypothetical protein